MTVSNTAPQGWSLPRILLHLEGLLVFVGVIILYAWQRWDGLLFVLLILAPDLAMLGYLRGARLGSVIYNIVHTYAAPGLLLLVAALTSTPLLFQIALIWIAHIGMDRFFGFGLKYPTVFKDTHLNRV